MLRLDHSQRFFQNLEDQSSILSLNDALTKEKTECGTLEKRLSETSGEVVRLSKELDDVKVSQHCTLSTSVYSLILETDQTRKYPARLKRSQRAFFDAGG
jgi:hypothetical protein